MNFKRYTILSVYMLSVLYGFSQKNKPVYEMPPPVIEPVMTGFYHPYENNAINEIAYMDEYQDTSSICMDGRYAYYVDKMPDAQHYTGKKLRISGTKIINKDGSYTIEDLNIKIIFDSIVFDNKMRKAIAMVVDKRIQLQGKEKMKKGKPTSTALVDTLIINNETTPLIIYSAKVNKVVDSVEFFEDEAIHYFDVINYFGYRTDEFKYLTNIKSTYYMEFNDMVYIRCTPSEEDFHFMVFLPSEDFKKKIQQYIYDHRQKQ